MPIGEMIIPLMLSSGQGVVGAEAEGVDLDGANDYLSRTSDFTGNSDSKTFTLSLWEYIVDDIEFRIYQVEGGYIDVLYSTTSKGILAHFYNAASSKVLTFETDPISLNTFSNIIVSVDLANTSNRSVYINDAVVSATWSTYVNDTIKFTRPDHVLGSTAFKGRLSHVFLDYTYRDLSVENNRRLFITEDLKPADSDTLIALSPIMYMPMADPDTWEVNEGTGGDFTANGTVALSGRGPNQFNGAMCTFDGSGDRMDLSTGATYYKQFTFNAHIRTDQEQKRFFSTTKGSPWQIDLNVYSNGQIEFTGKNFATTNILVFKTDISDYGWIKNRAFNLSMSMDMANQSNCQVLIDNVEIDVTYTVFTNDDLYYDYIYVGSLGQTLFFPGDLGEFWFDLVYTDLVSDNPFWDIDLNKPKPVRQVIAETGDTPLVALPMTGDNAGLNLGSEADFDETGEPYPGVRGMNEFWSRGVSNGVATAGVVYTNYLKNAGLTGAPSSTTTATLLFAVYNDDISHVVDTSIFGVGNDTGEFLAYSDNLEQLKFKLNNALVVARTAGTDFKTEKWTWWALTIDGTSARIYDGLTGGYSGVSFTDPVDLTGQVTFLSYPNDKDWPGQGSLLYFTDEYIDFSVESERLKFFDAFGYPIDLQPGIDNGDIPTPLIYMPFDDPDDLGANSGTGGDFTINGTVTPGADVDPNA